MSHQYKGLEPEQYEEHFSNFLINSWSYSKVSTFARHEAAFEMQYIFGLYSKSGPATIAGNAYHESLKYFFAQMKEGVLIDLVEMETSAFAYLENVPANRWKLGKTNTTIEECMIAATNTTNKLLKNFYAERGVYLDDIEEILFVEVYFSEWLTINGADIPLPCNGVIDLIVRTKEGKIAVIDHKSKTTYTDDKEASLAIGPQSITYAKAIEAKTGLKVDEVRFYENKHSTNKDGSAQVRPVIVSLDDNTRKLYEALLYDSLRRLILAVQDPNYTYMINLADNYVDMAEVLDFWCRVQICEVEDFNVEQGKKNLVAKRMKKVRDASIQIIPPEVIRRFKENADKFIQYNLSEKNMSQEKKIEHVLRSFNVLAEVAHKFEGFSSDTYLLNVGAGVKVGGIRKFRLDIANAMDVENVRISEDLVKHQGKSYLSIECPKERDGVLFYNPDDLTESKLPVGKDNYGKVIYWDLNNQSSPHMLVCGGTGSGKSVFLTSLIAYAKKAGVKTIIILDPKYEFTHLRGPGVDVINEVPEIEDALQASVLEMNRRVVDKESELALIVFDEYPDAIARARKGNELKKYDMVPAGNFADGSIKYKRECVGEVDSLGDNLAQLLQKGRSTGIRIVAAAQRASVKVIPGDAKNNFPVRVCFRVQQTVDSTVVLDEPGAEGLMGKGDGLIKSPEYRDTIRFQAYYKPQNQTA